MSHIPPNIQTLLQTVDHRISALEQFALRHRLSPKTTLPLLGSQRKFATPKALYNAIDSTIVRIEHIADKLPRNISYGRSHIQAKQIDYDPGEIFLKKLSKPLEQLLNICKDISKLNKDFGKIAPNIIYEQCKLLKISIKEQSILITKASQVPKPTDKQLKSMCENLIDSSNDVSDLKYEKGIINTKLYDHSMALGDTAALLGWVVSPTPLKYVKEYGNIIERLTCNILSNYIELGCNPSHSTFAECLNNLVDIIVKYVEKEHPAGLRWNYAKGTVPDGYKRAKRELRKDSHPIGDYYKLIDGSVFEFGLICKEFNSSLLIQASEHIKNIYEELAKAIENAASRNKPKGWGDDNVNVGDDIKIKADLKMLLMSVQNEITHLEKLLDSVDELDKFYLHVEALKEFLLCMQWSSATMQKMSPVSYIIDIENITNCYLDKVVQQFGPNNNDNIKKVESWRKWNDDGDIYIKRLHGKWCDCIKGMINELKDYVKLHHPNELMFDTGRSRNSVDDLIKSVSLDKQLEELKLKSTTKKWKCVETVKRSVNSKKMKKKVRTWVRVGNK